MDTRRTLSRTLAVICLLFVSATPALAVNFIQAAAPSNGGTSTVIVNLTNGNITVCPALSNASGTPLGTCERVSTISVAGVGGISTNMQISTPNGSNATITNLINGAVVQCSLLINANNGNLIGTCKGSRAF